MSSYGARFSGVLLILTVFCCLASAIHDIEVFAEFSFFGHNDEVASSNSQAQLNHNVLKKSWKDFKNEVKNIKTYPSTFYGQSNYAMIAEFVDHDFSKTPMPWTLAEFGGASETDKIKTYCDTSCLVSTDLLPSAFTRPTLDGEIVQSKDIWSISKRVTFVVPSGPHVVGISMIGSVVTFFKVARWVGLAWAIASGLYCLSIGFVLLARDVESLIMSFAWVSKILELRQYKPKEID